MTVTCEIKFDQNPHGTYFAGQVVSGKVTVNANKAKNVQGIALKISGFAHTAWTESTRSKGKTRTTSYSGREDYISSTTYLIGSDSSTGVLIQPGIHTYSFACPLPALCPSSYEGQYGHVRYVAKVALIRPWKFDQTYTVGFTVLKLLDLNYDSPVLRLPTNMEYVKRFCCWPCQSEPMIMTVTVPQTGYVPGQMIPVSVNVDNPTKVPVKEIKIGLYLHVTFYSTCPSTRTKADKICLVKSKSGEICEKSKSMITESLRVPPVPPTCQNLCRVIHISYNIEVTAKIGGMHTSPVISVPITIGNVPLMNFNNQYKNELPSAPEQLACSEQPDSGDFNSLPVIDPVINPTAPYSPDSPNIPPPSYEEALYMVRATVNEDDLTHTLGTTDFSPRYPVYSLLDDLANLPDEAPINTDLNKSTWL